jgi:hypothetical protein
MTGKDEYKSTDSGPRALVKRRNILKMPGGIAQHDWYTVLFPASAFFLHSGAAIILVTVCLVYTLTCGWVSGTSSSDRAGTLRIGDDFRILGMDCFTVGKNLLFE